MCNFLFHLFQCLRQPAHEVLPGAAGLLVAPALLQRAYCLHSRLIIDLAVIDLDGVELDAVSQPEQLLDRQRADCAVCLLAMKAVEQSCGKCVRRNKICYELIKKLDKLCKDGVEKIDIEEVRSMINSLWG